MAVTDAPFTAPSKLFKEDQKQHRANLKALEDFAQTVFTQLVPVGCILAYGGSVAPAGWLVCDNSAKSRAAYATLFTIIGTRYGAGDGTTTFNIPPTTAVTHDGNTILIVKT